MATQPNIIVILVDDMGFSDLGCYGGEALTPNLDKLAAGGVRFTDFYCTPRCCPSRASLLTGLTPHKAGIGWMSFDWMSNVDPRADGYVGTLNHNCVTIAEALKPAGYTSYISGKWHVTSEQANKATWPTSRGFDRSFALIPGGTNYYHPTQLSLDEKFYRAPKETYFTDLIGNYATKFVDEHFAGTTGGGSEAGASPFFMYLAFTAPHFPIQAPDEVAEKYREIYAKGWDELRHERYERMINMGIIKPEWELPPRPESVPAWSSLPEYKREKQAQVMATYAAMIEIMDANVGKVVAALERAGELDNTAIMFLSDNGACAEGPVMGSGSLYGECWAHLSNTPLQLYKHFTMQGGVQTPFILHYPNGSRDSAADAGHMTDWTGCLYDIMPTCLDLAGADYPGERNGNAIHPLDGTSLTPALGLDDDVTAARQSRPDIHIEHEGNQMLRAGNRKVVRQHTDEYWQLYDMDGDRTEMRDLSGVEPDKLTELAHKYYQWESQARVIPWALSGMYMDRHGYDKHRKAFYDEFDAAMGAADPEDIVDGEALGD